MSKRNRRAARNRNRRKRYGGRKKQPVIPEKPPLPDRLHQLRVKAWQCGAIASCIQYASDSCLAEKNGKPDIQNAAEALYDMLGEISGPLEDIIEELGGTTPEEDDEW